MGKMFIYDLYSTLYAILTTLGNPQTRGADRYCAIPKEHPANGFDKPFAANKFDNKKYILGGNKDEAQSKSNGH